MIGHISVPSIEPDPNRPASISPLVVNGLLKKQLGPNGLKVVTDALDMGALHGSLYRIGCRDFCRGSSRGGSGRQRHGDYIPGDLGGAYNGLLDAVKQDKITQQRILTDSVRRFYA